MRTKVVRRITTFVTAGLVCVWPTTGRAQLGGLTGTVTATTITITDTATAVSGQAQAVRATVAGLLGSTTTTLADTGTLGGSTDAREAEQLTGSVPFLLTGETLHATSIGWPDQAASEASLTNLALTVAGTTIGADSVMAQVLRSLGGGVGTTSIDGLSINGLAVAVTGAPNQTVSIPGGLLVINEQRTSSTSTSVDALHLVVYGLADVVIASATAGIQ
jgi:hypothetical protein